jgi:hypothetical protein
VRISPLAIVVVAAACAACAKKPEPDVNARPMTAAEVAAAKVQPGDCVEARRRAAIKSDLEVDRLPELVSGPRPFTPTPTSVTADIEKNGMSFKANVVIDTLGRARVSTLKVLETSNEWFPRNLKALLPRMRFSPAMLAGCKVDRVYLFQASAKPKGQA